ncbi:hypothetical protein Mapa_013719 [Marchantia paleacea]|nr:hypothetical protein Mapa_013719 [Marchantia paleacea]
MVRIKTASRIDHKLRSVGYLTNLLQATYLTTEFIYPSSQYMSLCSKYIITLQMQKFLLYETIASTGEVYMLC